MGNFLDSFKTSESFFFQSWKRRRVPKSNLVPGNWLPTTEKQTRYLQINAQSPKLVNDSMPFESQLAFWYDLLDS